MRFKVPDRLTVLQLGSGSRNNVVTLATPGLPTEENVEGALWPRSR